MTFQCPIPSLHRCMMLLPIKLVIAICLVILLTWTTYSFLLALSDLFSCKDFLFVTGSPALHLRHQGYFAVPPLPFPWCGKFKPKLLQKFFLRKSQDLHLDVVPTTYAKRSLRKKSGFHTNSQIRNSSTLLGTHSEVR